MNHSRLLSTFLNLVQIDSPSGFESRLADTLLGYLSSLNLAPFMDAGGNVLVQLEGTGRPLFLTAHMDTVEPGRGIKPQVTDGIIRSSGNTILGADNKLGLSVILETLTVFSQSERTHRPLEVVFTVSEESGNLGAVSVDLSGFLSAEGYSFDASGSLGTIITASPFYNRFDIKISGKSSHAAHPEAAVNVLNILGPAFSKIKIGAVDPETLVNIGTFSGGSVRNTVPGRLFLSGEVRSFSKTGLDRATSRLMAEFFESAKHSGLVFESDVVTENSGFVYPNSHPAIGLARKTVKSCGLKPVLAPTYACFDANIFHARGIDVVNLSDGSRNNHTPAESVSVSDLNKLADICYKLCV